MRVMLGAALSISCGEQARPREQLLFSQLHDNPDPSPSFGAYPMRAGVYCAPPLAVCAQNLLPNVCVFDCLDPHSHRKPKHPRTLYSRLINV